IIDSHSLSYFYISSHAVHRNLHSFPTRRSSDLTSSFLRLSAATVRSSIREFCISVWILRSNSWWRRSSAAICPSVVMTTPCKPRSEEHTSELQSRENLVCRLLLEKKKKKK